MKLRPKLTVKYVREHFNQVNVFSKFLDIPHDDIIDCITEHSTILSPIRSNDGSPSVGFKYDNKGRLKMRDFNGTFWGDIFDLVSHLYKLKVDNKSQFYTILKIIYDAMLDDEYKDIITEDIKARLQNSKKEKLVIDLNIRNWNNRDADIWNKLDLSYDDLTKGYVFPVENYWVNIDSNPQPKYYYKPNNPCYAYWFGYDDKGVANYRLYFPKKSKFYPKFITNNNVIQGMNTLDSGYDAIVITKSYKDVLFLRKLWNTHFSPTGGLHIGFVAPPAENYKFTIYDIATLRSKTTTGELLTVFDFDYTGITGTNRLKKEHGIPYLFLTNGSRNTVDYGAKDPTDYYELHGEAEILALINNVLDLIL